ncbi:MAG: hypothetical protein AB3A66_28920 (plasmid) [Nodularia sp. CChRGM 3473]
MTDTPEYFPNRLDRIEQIMLGLAEQQANTQTQLVVCQDNFAKLNARI